LKILFVAPWIPSKIRPRSLGILRDLAQKHEVWFVGLDAPGERHAELESVELAGTTIVPISVWRARLRAALALGDAKASLQASYVAERGLVEAYHSLRQSFRPQVLHFNVIRSAFLLGDDVTERVFFDMDEIRSSYYRQVAAGGRSAADRVIGVLESRRMRYLEDRVCARAGVVAVSSPLDTDLLGRKGALVRSPSAEGLCGIEEPGSREPGGDFRILFVGRMGYAPNRQALEWFVDQVFRPLREGGLRAVLSVVGEGAERLRVRGVDGVECLGFVESLSEVYRHASVCIVPVFVGSGVQMKLIQGLEAGLPTVTTRAVALRAGIRPGFQAFAADTPEEWRSALVELASDPDQGRPMARRGREWAIQNHGRAAVSSQLWEAYGRL